MLIVKVLGPGCANCRRVEAAAHQALAQLGAEAQVLKITNYDEMLKYPIVATPGLVLNEHLVCAGRIPSVAEVTGWITTFMEETANELTA